jgi:hypothetical protein
MKKIVGQQIQDETIYGIKNRSDEHKGYAWKKTARDYLASDACRKNMKRSHKYKGN